LSRASSFARDLLCSFNNYIEICKPRVVLLMILTSFVGMCLASASFPSLKIIILANIGIGFAAASAAAINHMADYRIDRLMSRTHNRPIATGSVSFTEALVLSLALGISGISILCVYVNLLTAFLTFLSMIGYAGIYTFYLKHNTPQNIVIGGLAGAAPPLLGWVAVTNSVQFMPVILVLIIFFWTPPHFWALAIDRIEDYKKTNVPMLPITHGIPHTKKSMLFYTVLLSITTLVPVVMSYSRLLYFIGVVTLDAWFFFNVFRLYQDQANKNALKVFKDSIVYLMLLFVVLLLDHYIPITLL
jgi:heme o synthase